MKVFINIKKQNPVYDSVNLRVLTLLLMGVVLIWVTACASLALPENENTGAQENVPSPTASLDIQSLSGVSILVATIPPTGTPTPGPTPTPSKTPTPRPTITPTPIPSACKIVGQWETYTNSDVGYTLQYPAEAELWESSKSDYTSIFLQPSCYDIVCSEPTRIVVRAFNNPKRMPIQKFVEETFQLYSNPPFQNATKNYEMTSRFFTVANVQALRIDAGIFADGQPSIFIPHGEHVVNIGVGPASKMISPYAPPCDKVLELLEQVLTSITLLP